MKSSGKMNFMLFFEEKKLLSSPLYFPVFVCEEAAIHLPVNDQTCVIHTEKKSSHHLCETFISFSQWRNNAATVQWVGKDSGPTTVTTFPAFLSLLYYPTAQVDEGECECDKCQFVKTGSDSLCVDKEVMQLWCWVHRTIWVCQVW